MVIIRKINNNKCWLGWGAVGDKEPTYTLIHCWWELVQSLWKLVQKFLKKLKIELPYNLVIPLLSKYPKESKSTYNRDDCIPMFIVTLLTILKLWNQVDKWIKKMWYIYIMEF
jgi:hypothetical protein